jgi:hypothetical protein
VYHPDGTDDHGRFTGLGVDFAAYAIPRLQERYSATAHSITNTRIELVDDDTAYVESHVCARHLRQDEHGPLLEVFGGRYVDRFERRDGEWKIADRVVVHDWDTVERLETAFPPDRFARGARGRDDPSYRRR